VKLSPGRFSSFTCSPISLLFSSKSFTFIYSAMKRISNNQTAHARVASCVYRFIAGNRGNSSVKVGWVMVVICNRSTHTLPFIYECSRKARSIPASASLSVLAAVLQFSCVGIYVYDELSKYTGRLSLSLNVLQTVLFGSHAPANFCLAHVPHGNEVG
jgi:hypothetical protein